MGRPRNGGGKRGYEQDAHPARQWNKWGKTDRFAAPPKANRFELQHGLESGDPYLHNLVDGRGKLSPEQKLLLACLADALRCLRDGYETREMRRGYALWESARDWIEAPDDGSLFCFCGVCLHLGIDPGFIRRYARRWM